jgi:hypothetical protein
MSWRWKIELRNRRKPFLRYGASQFDLRSAAPELEGASFSETARHIEAYDMSEKRYDTNAIRQQVRQYLLWLRIKIAFSVCRRPSRCTIRV